MAHEESSPQDRRWRWDERVPLRWLLVDECTMGESDTAVAVCSDVEGLFVDEPSAVRKATLLGCLPCPPLRRALDALAEGGARHRRLISASLYSVDRDGAASGVVGAGLQASVADVRPSTLSAELLDVTFDTAFTGALPGAARQIWDLWHSGRPAAPGLWAGYDRELRHCWSGAALSHHRADAPDKPAGTVYHLDGRHVTDVEGFYCAIGEAVNGPGGYFGWNGDALHDCVRGGFGAESPFRIVWHDAAVAQESVPEFDRILRWLTEDRIEVELR
ncbi:barstar family protein [Actinoplanes sp. NPDC049548]|uniref:barstar family protein n=1 Tax=Actinoplanes sp. NPDC049548 TaxID=3155152 RepID=UPI0034262685